jgi:carbon-monoxide dehydrogenase medium subunit
MRRRVLSPSRLIDITRLPGLAAIRKENDAIIIGALTTHEMLEYSQLLMQDCALLAETAAHIADPLVRNRGTIGGSLCYADPAGDLPLAAVALDARLIAVGPRGERSIAAEAFFVDEYRNALRPGEILTAVRFASTPTGSGGAHVKLSRRFNGPAIVGAAAMVRTGADGMLTEVRLCLGGMGPRPLRAIAVEAALIGQRVTAEIIQRVTAQHAAAGAAPIPTIHGSASYRMKVAPVLATRALLKACERAGLSV